MFYDKSVSREYRQHIIRYVMYSALANSFTGAHLAEPRWDGVDIVEDLKELCVWVFLEETMLLKLSLNLLLWKSCFLFIENRV